MGNRTVLLCTRNAGKKRQVGFSVIKIATLWSHIASGDEIHFWGHPGSSAWKRWVCHSIRTFGVHGKALFVQISHYFSHSFLENAEKQRHSSEMLCGGCPSGLHYGVRPRCRAVWGRRDISKRWAVALSNLGLFWGTAATWLHQGIRPMVWSPAVFHARKHQAPHQPSSYNLWEVSRKIGNGCAVFSFFLSWI